MNGNKLHRYTGIIKCADCGSSMIARKRKWRGNEYTEYTCNSCHRYGKQSQDIQGIIDEGIISNTHLRMLVNQVQIHQNEDKSLDIKFRMNGNWSGGVAVYVEPENEVITCS